MLITKLASLKSVDALRARFAELGCELPIDDKILTATEASPLAAPLTIAGHQVGNRWCIQPMEGWDAELDGRPSDHTLRRWRHFGRSGAKLIWGGEAAAVQHDGRANPRQVLATPETKDGLAALFDTLMAEHRARFDRTDDLFVGLQLTHSGRFSRPNGEKLEPRIAYHHPILDRKLGIDPDDASVIWKDEDIDRLIDQFVIAAGLAHDVGFQFVDVKACHGYLLHELLSGYTRPGRFGGDLAGRSRALCEIVSRVREAYPDLVIGVRLSAYDSVPFVPGSEHGQPAPYDACLPYRYAFGVNPQNPLEIDLSEVIELVQTLEKLGVSLLNLSCGSPYYTPHLQRPAFYPPSDGYLPPEDPLVGVWRQIDAVRQVKQAIGTLPIVGSGYTYLQHYLPHVAQAVVRAGWVDFIGLGRMVLSYPELPADTLSKGQMDSRRICRTFSDCTTAPRKGLVSGCYPLDAYYKELPEAQRLAAAKRESKK